MVFPGDAPRAVEVMGASAAAASSSPSPSPPPHRPLVLRGKPRSRHHPVPPLRAAAWANQRLHRCVSVEGAGNTPAATSLPAPATAPERKSPVTGTGDDGFERIRAKLMDHLREAVGRIELPTAAASGETKRNHPATVPVKEAGQDDDEHHEAPPASSSRVPTLADDLMSVAAAPTASVSAGPTTAVEDLPWNLRTRKSAAASCNGRQHHPNAQPDPVSQAASPPAKTASRLRSGARERRGSPLRRRRPRFSVPLTKEEIDEDLYAFTGRRASRRPKKRPRIVQKQLDMLFPGLWLSEVTADAYQVADPTPPPPS